MSRNEVNIIGRDIQNQFNIVVDSQVFGIVPSVSIPEKCLQFILHIDFELFKCGLGHCTTAAAKLILKDDA